MKVRILAIGTRMPQWVELGFQEYTQRIRPHMSLELVEIPMAKRAKKTDIERAVSEEAEALRKSLKPREKLVLLEVKGKPISTPMLAKKLAMWKMEGQDIAIVIGGPDGLEPAMQREAQELWSISELTLPHPLVRVVLAEQMYRGLMINANHPYHRD